MAKREKDNVLVRFSSWFFVNWRFTLLLWVFILGSGAAIYTNVIKREGFPPIQFPLSVVSGTYFVDDASKVDNDVSLPLSKLFTSLDSVDKVQATAGDNFFSAVVQFKTDVIPSEGTRQLQDAVANAEGFPAQASVEYTTIDPAGFLNKYDMLLSVYSTEPTTVAKLEEAARYVSDKLIENANITLAEPQNLLQTGVNPQTNQEETRQTAFSRIGLVQEDGVEFYQSLVVGLDRNADNLDILEFSELVSEKITELDLSEFGESFEVTVGADYAESITTQISSLQSNLFTGLLAVAVVSLLLITWRASIITGLFMITVMAVTIAVLYLLGYTLNTITLFALVLSLGLFVDDATIVVEALDANRTKKKKPLEVVRNAIKRVGSASFAGTFTTVLVFLPLAFITGILGEFIRLMPITIITALLTSLVLSLTVIPLLAKFILLNHVQESWFTRINPVSKLEKHVGTFVGSLPRYMKTNKKIGRPIAVGMVVLSIVMVMLAGSFAQKLSFNIFPPSKDSDQIGIQITYPNGFTLSEAEAVVDTVNTIINDQVGDLTRRVTYGSFNQPNERSADALVELVPFNTRDVKSPELMERLQNGLNDGLPEGVSTRVIQYDAGPPASEFPLMIQIYTEDEQKASNLASEIVTYIDGAELTRTNGTTATIDRAKLPNPVAISRVDDKRVFEVQGSFDADDTSALVIAAEEYVKEKFTPEYLNERGFAESDLGFDFGQESENEESFSALGVIFPIALLAMYILLALQFRSALQPLLIFMAIPFSLFGVFGGLYLTNNSLSFFAMIGLIGLIGIAVNNTILLTDYANQERRDGEDAVDAIANAATKRFRPLVTTTLTTVVALLPLALSDPFWEALAFTIIFGLLSSTFLVLLSFPYYYLAAEWLRTKSAKLAKNVVRKATSSRS